MSILTFFHFDKIPFPSNSSFNYVFFNRSQFKIINSIVNNSRFHHGVFSIFGHSGVGKSFVLYNIFSQVKNNDLAYFFSINENSNLLKLLSSQLSIKKTDLDSISTFLLNAYKNGKNVFLFFDDFHNISKKDASFLLHLYQNLPFINIVIASQYSFKKTLRNLKIAGFNSIPLFSYKLSHFSIFKAMRYIKSISIQALSLSQYKNIFSLPKRFLIAFFSNRNINDINLIASSSLQEAFKDKSHIISFKHILRAIKSNISIVKDNLYFKFQKIFFAILLLLSFFFFAKLIYDRQFLIQTIEIEKSIDQQEQTFKNFF